MMSVFCSHTLIFAPECQKYILRGPDFKTSARGHVHRPLLVTCTFGTCKLHLWCNFFFFLLCLLQSFCHLLKTLLTTQISKLLHEGIPPDPPSNLHFRRLQVAPVVQVFVPSLPTPKLLPPT